MSDDNGEQPQAERIPRWSIRLATVITLAAVGTFVAGLLLSSGDGQTPKESYTLTVLLTLLSVAAGWIISLLMQQHQAARRAVDERHREDMTETIARSAAVRIFRSLDGLGRIQETAMERDGTAADLRSRLHRVQETAKLVFDNTGDSITDWRRFAPVAVDDELSKVHQSVRSYNDSRNAGAS